MDMLTFYNKNCYKNYQKEMKNVTAYFKTKTDVVPFQLVCIKKAYSKLVHLPC